MLDATKNVTRDEHTHRIGLIKNGLDSIKIYSFSCSSEVPAAAERVVCTDRRNPTDDKHPALLSKVISILDVIQRSNYVLISINERNKKKAVASVKNLKKTKIRKKTKQKISVP